MMQAFKDDRKGTYLNSEGADKPLKSPVSDDVPHKARLYRIARVKEQLVANDCAAALLYDSFELVPT